VALRGYLSITNQAGQVLEGDCGVSGYEHWIPIWSGHHRVSLPMAASGLPNGKRQHYAIQVCKAVDRTSPILYSHLSSGRVLKEVVIDWCRVHHQTQAPEAYFRQTLSDVQITEMGFQTQSGASNDEGGVPSLGHMESVQFIYDNITWSYLDGGIEFEERVKSKPQKSAAEPLQPKVKVSQRVLWQPQCRDQMPIPEDYRATLLVYGSDTPRILSQSTVNISRESQSRTFQLAKGEPFDVFFIEPTMHSVLQELKANRHIQRSVSDGVIQPLALQGSDTTSAGHTLHYAPVDLIVERQVQIVMQYDPLDDTVFELSGSSALSETASAANPDKAKPPIVFGPLKGDESFALSASEAGRSPVSLLPSTPLADWLHKDTLLAHGFGSKGGPQLFAHKVLQGHIPQLTLMPAPPQFGVFFDGTGNNKTNDNVDLNDDKEPTNIAKLSELYRTDDYTQWYYEEGIGTRAHEKDRDIDMATAYSLDEHINRALIEVQKHFQRFRSSAIGFIDVFGFSRGATQARMMVNVIHHLNAHQPDYWGGPKLVVRFVGLYDTVGSVGVGGDNDNEWCFATGDLPGAPQTATLDLAPHAACAVYHLMALDEQRENFPVSSLRSSKTATLPKHFIEEGVLGAHADVGGGYGNGSSTIYYPIQPLDYARREATPQRLAADKQRLKRALEAQYYRPGINIEFKETSWVDHRNSRDSSARKVALKPYWKRQVSNQLAHLYLKAMHQQAIRYGVPFDPITELDNFTHPSNNQRLYKYDTPAKLEQLCQQAIGQGVGSQAYNALSEHYIHHSHKYVGLTDTLAHGPEAKPKHSFGHYGREVFYASNTGLGDQGTWEKSTNQSGSIQWHKT